MRNCLQHMLDQGFGLYSINDAISIQYCNDSMNLVVTEIPALNDEPVFLPILSRTPGEIRNEIASHINVILSLYRDIMWRDIQRL